MAGQARYVFIASMDVEPDKEDLFNEVYDMEHVPLLLQVPGVLSVTRYKNTDFSMIIGGERQRITAGGPKYAAVYELASPDVLTSEAWAKAVDHGRWPTEVRPYTHNRRHMLHQVIDPQA